MNPLTKRQQQVLDFIKRFRAKHSFSPTSYEIAKHFKFAQTAAINHVKALARKGAVTTTPGASRTIVPV